MKFFFYSVEYRYSITCRIRWNLFLVIEFPTSRTRWCLLSSRVSSRFSTWWNLINVLSQILPDRRVPHHRVPMYIYNVVRVQAIDVVPLYMYWLKCFGVLLVDDSIRSRLRQYVSAVLMCCRYPLFATSGYRISTLTPVCEHTSPPPSDHALQHYVRFGVRGAVFHNTPCW